MKTAPASAADERAAIAAAVCRFTAFTPLSERAIATLMTMAEGHREVARGEYIVHEGDAPNGIHLLIVGWTASSVGFASGRRQLIKIHLPGDLLGLPSLALDRAADTIVALTDCVIARIPPAEIGLLFDRSPRLAALLFLISQEERIRLMDRIASVGATAAINRLAAFLVEIHARVVRSNPTIGNAFDLPLLQSDVADIIGVSVAHLNRTVQRLRSDAVVGWQRQRVTINNLAALGKLAELPPRSLGHEPTWLPKGL